MDAKEFLTSAQELIQGNREVDYRNAASRAYYYTFHICRTLLAKLPHSQSSIGASHEKVVLDLLSYPDKKLNTFGRKLEQAKTLRHQADYKLLMRFSRANAKLVLRHAHDISSGIDDFWQSKKNHNTDS